MMKSPKDQCKEYLGDSVYAEECDGSVILTTENGFPTDPSNKIWLEPAVIRALFRFCKSRGFEE